MLDIPTDDPEQKGSSSPEKPTPEEKLPPTGQETRRSCKWSALHVVSETSICVLSPAVQQLELLESRKKQYLKSALQAKQKNDLDQARVLLRTAKSLEPMIDAARSGQTVDISAVRQRRVAS